MWLRSHHDDGLPTRRYSTNELAALLEPLGFVLDSLGHASVRDVVGEAILQRMEAPELVFALHETFRALLEDIAVPERGHPGYQQAAIAELLAQTHGLIEGELFDPAEQADDHARVSAWRSFTALCGEKDPLGRRVYPLLEDPGLDGDEPGVHRSPRLTSRVWETLLLDEAGGVVAEFLADDDWRMDWLLDHPRDETRWVVNEAGIDLDTVHQLPHSPTAEEAVAAESYLRALVTTHERGR